MGNKKLVRVEFALENCELISFEGNDIIEYGYPSVAMLLDGDIHFNDFYIKISKNARKKERINFSFGGYVDEIRDIFDRIIEGKDICQVLFYNEEYELHCFIPYGVTMDELVLGDDSYKLDDEGNLVIHVTYTLESEKRLLDKRFIDFDRDVVCSNDNKKSDIDDSLDDESFDDSNFDIFLKNALVLSEDEVEKLELKDIKFDEIEGKK